MLTTDTRAKGASCAGTHPFLRAELLPFTLTIAQSQQELQQAAALRFDAYARHLDPAQIEGLKRPDDEDLKPETAVFLVRSKETSEVLGTMRVQTNVSEKLGIEKSVPMPPDLQGKKLAEATRLGVQVGPNAGLVRNTLFKAYYVYCLQNDVPYMVISARKPVDKIYQRLYFKDILPGGQLIPLPYAFNIPHRMMYFDVFDAERDWGARGHPLNGFMHETRHPDIRL